MVKHFKNRCLRASKLILFIYISTSCVNNIQEKDDSLIANPIPIHISSQIASAHTRITNNTFTTNDAIGLYLLPESKPITEKRYIDNMRFVCQEGLFRPEQPAYYPTGTQNYDFISYYPYRENAILPQESSILVSVNDNQELAESYNASDFLVALRTGVTPSSQLVELRHEHKMCQLTFIVQLTDDDDIHTLKDNISITIHNTATQAVYQFTDDTFSAASTPKDVVPYGTWKVDPLTHQLSGKKALLIPQDLGDAYLTFHAQGRSYPVVLPTDMELGSGKSSELTLKYSSKIGVKGIFPSIGEWNEGTKNEITIDTEEPQDVLLISDLDFATSNVYHLVNADRVVLAEVCQEYLVNSSINAQAIVLYPAGVHNGTVLRLLNTAGQVHGGIVSWQEETNSLIYTAGTQGPVDKLYTDVEGRIVFTQPEQTQLMLPRPSTLIDTRGNERITYPIVKIGTQYWMRENLRTLKYNDATPIDFITDLTDVGAGYYVSDEVLFYNKPAVLKDKLAPSGWITPQPSDWKTLEKYVGELNSAALKVGEQWASFEDVFAPSNLSYFGAYPFGFFSTTGNADSAVYVYKNKRASFWQVDHTATPSKAQGIVLLHDRNSMAPLTNEGSFAGHAIRCLKIHGE